MDKETCLGCEKGIDPEEEVLLCTRGKVHLWVDCLEKAAKAERIPDRCCAGCSSQIASDDEALCLPDGRFIHEEQYCLISYLTSEKRQCK